MYYRDRSFDLDWLLIFLSLCVLAFAVLWQPPSGKVLSKGFYHVLVLDAEKKSDIMYITLWLPNDANICLDGRTVPVSAGKPRFGVPLSDGAARFCVMSGEYNDCGVVFTIPS